MNRIAGTKTVKALGPVFDGDNGPTRCMLILVTDDADTTLEWVVGEQVQEDGEATRLVNAHRFPGGAKTLAWRAFCDCVLAMAHSEDCQSEAAADFKIDMDEFRMERLTGD